MSLSFIVTKRDRKRAGSSNAEGNVGEPSSPSSSAAAGSAQPTLKQFWTNVTADMMKISSDDFKTQAFPLARIKKIMKLDDEVKMISTEAPVLFAKAVEIFVHELTLRAWGQAENNNRRSRRTLQRNDIAKAISKSDQYDFLIDIVPRHEVKTKKPRIETVWSHAKPTTSGNARKQQQPCLQQSNQQQQLQATFLQTTQQPQFVLQNMAQVVQNPNPQPVALVQAVQSHPVVSNPELQNIPVTSQGQHQQQQVYFSEVQPSQDAS